MRLEVIASDAWVVLSFVDSRGHCPVKETLGDVQRTAPTAHAELCRKPKPRELRALIRRAQGLRSDYLAASAAGDIVIERGA
jgi:hypothetical protein